MIYVAMISRTVPKAHAIPAAAILAFVSTLAAAAACVYLSVSSDSEPLFVCSTEQRPRIVESQSTLLRDIIFYIYSSLMLNKSVKWT